MHFSAIVAAALLPLLAVAETSTLTSYLTMTKTITIEKAATYTAYNTTSSYYLPTGTGAITVLSSTTTVPAGATKTTTSATVSPTINAAGSLSAAKVAAAGVAGMVMAAFM